MEMLVLWILFMFIAAWVGNGKGRGGAGLLLGLFLGPIGIVLTGLLTGDRRKCPECQAWIPNTATRCMHCRADVTPTALSKPRH